MVVRFDSFYVTDENTNYLSALNTHTDKAMNVILGCATALELEG